jgi:hypothetical protein
MVDEDALAAQHLDERVVFLARAAGPEHVVEQQLVAVARGEPVELEAGPVNDGLSEPTDFGADPERVGHGGRLSNRVGRRGDHAELTTSAGSRTSPLRSRRAFRKASSGMPTSKRGSA